MSDLTSAVQDLKDTLQTSAESFKQAAIRERLSTLEALLLGRMVTPRYPERQLGMLGTTWRVFKIQIEYDKHGDVDSQGWVIGVYKVWVSIVGGNEYYLVFSIDYLLADCILTDEGE